MDYVKLRIKVAPQEPFCDLITYHLSDCGFDTFEENAEGLDAYCPEAHYHADEVKDILKQITTHGAVLDWSEEKIPWKNWNEEWEKQYAPELIAETIYVRALFHEPRPEYPFEIVIQPRMAFGTGHHPTTSLVMQSLLKLDLKDKTVIDMGCGTGILGILAILKGAKSVLAIDIDPVAVENTIDNFALNKCQPLRALTGTSKQLEGEHADLFLANINRNIILEDLPLYKASMNPGALLLTSGYYEQDLPLIRKKAESLGLQYCAHDTRQDWCCAQFKNE